MLTLDNVTLLGVDGAGNSPETIKAMKYSCKNIIFGKKLFLTSSPDKYDNSFCEINKIDKLSYYEFSKFYLTEIYKFIKTEFILTIHPDGFVLNSHLWLNEFMNYDYIGAPWTISNVTTYCKTNNVLYDSFKKNKEIYQVGNGGFSLRSKKLLEQTSKLYLDKYNNLNEDVVIGIIMREELETLNIKFPSVDLASQFSCEDHIINGKKLSTNDTFGFHGKTQHPHLLKLLNE